MLLLGCKLLLRLCQCCLEGTGTRHKAVCTWFIGCYLFLVQSQKTRQGSDLILVTMVLGHVGEDMSLECMALMVLFAACCRSFRAVNLAN